MIAALLLSAAALAPGARLEQAIDRYQAIVTAGGFPPLTPGPTLEMGSRGPAVVALRARLAVEGDLGPLPPEDASTFDEGVAQAVRSFQQRHGLEEDGRVGGATRRAISVSAQTRLRALERTRRRMARLPADLGHRAILVNVAGPELWALVDGELALRSRVITGRRDWPTPLMSDAVRGVEVNPRWIVPPRMVREEMLPRLALDPLALKGEGIVVVDRATGAEVDPAAVRWAELDAAALPYRLEQPPGPGNPLGTIMLLLGNGMAIRLHGTCDAAAFDRIRHGSHGCVRVESIEAVARFVLDDALAQRRLDDALRDPTTTAVFPVQPVPVHFVYFTAWADEQGKAHFRPDVYRLDRAEGRTPR